MLLQVLEHRTAPLKSDPLQMPMCRRSGPCPWGTWLYFYLRHGAGGRPSAELELFPHLQGLALCLNGCLQFGLLAG